MVEVDARGFSCPIPVVQTKKALEDNPNKPVTVLVESETSKENVRRLAHNKGYSVNIEGIEDGFKMSLSPRIK